MNSMKVLVLVSNMCQKSNWYLRKKLKVRYCPELSKSSAMKIAESLHQHTCCWYKKPDIVI